MNIKKFLLGPVICLTLLLGHQRVEAAIVTDIVIIVDESGSMGTVQANLRNNIGQFASILSAGGLDARFALVGYGNAQIIPRLLSDLTNAANFATAALGLQVNGGTEPGYIASLFAMNALDNQNPLISFRQNSIKNLIIFTDEPSNGDSQTIGGEPRFGSYNNAVVTQNVVDSVLKENNALFNAVVSGTSTINSYSNLATGNGGQVFNLSLFNTNNQQQIAEFVDDFANAKLQETLDFCVLNPSSPACNPTRISTPATLMLFSIGFMGIAIGRRRKSSDIR